MELSLQQKGIIAPPPVLAQPYRQVVDEVAGWPGVIAATHWHLYRPTEVDGADFYVGNKELGDRELGHIHLDGQVHLATDQALHDEFLAAGRAEPFPFGGSYRNWVLFRLRVEGDVPAAIELFRRNYQRLAQLD